MEIRDRRFWAKNDGAIARGCHMRVFLERFSRFLGRFSQKRCWFLQKSKEMERFLKILKKGGRYRAESVIEPRRARILHGGPSGITKKGRF